MNDSVIFSLDKHIFFFRLKTPCNAPHVVQRVLQTPSAPRCRKKCKNKIVKSKKSLRLLTKYPCKSRQGMSAAVDTAWHKRGFDSLTCKTIL